MMSDLNGPVPSSDTRSALELAQTAKARFETTEAAATAHGLDLERVKTCAENLLDGIHRGPQQALVVPALPVDRPGHVDHPPARQGARRGDRGDPRVDSALWVLEIALAMITAVMAVNREPLPVASQVDPASYAMSVLRDLATAAREKGLDWVGLETAAAEGLRRAEADGFTNQEAYWALNRATASLELAWARSLAEQQGNPFSEEP